MLQGQSAGDPKARDLASWSACQVRKKPELSLYRETALAALDRLVRNVTDGVFSPYVFRRCWLHIDHKIIRYVLNGVHYIDIYLFHLVGNMDIVTALASFYHLCSALTSSIPRLEYNLMC